MHHNQKGIGIADVMVALTLLSVGVLGFVGMQLKATQNSMNNLNKVKSSIIAMDFAEKVRTNPEALDEYYSSMESATTQKGGSGLNCYTQFCSSNDKAKADVYQSYVSASKSGIIMALNNCPISSARKCLYLVWGTTTPNHGGNLSCTITSSNKMVYRDGSTCLVQELF